MPSYDFILADNKKIHAFGSDVKHAISRINIKPYRRVKDRSRGFYINVRRYLKKVFGGLS